MRRLSQVSQLSVDVLKGTLSSKEIKALASMSSKLGDGQGRFPRRGSQTSLAQEEPPWLASPRSSSGSRGSGSLPKLPVDAYTHARGEESPCSTPGMSASFSSRPRTRLCLSQHQDEAGQSGSPRSQPLPGSLSHRELSPGGCSSKCLQAPRTLQPQGPQSERQHGMAPGFMSPRASRMWELEPISTHITQTLPVVPPMVRATYALRLRLFSQAPKK